MPIIAVRNTQTLDQLIGKTYTNLSAAQLKAVRAATLAANPHLNEATPLQPGVVVVVPTLQGDTPSVRASDSITGDVAKTLRTALGSYREELAQRIDGRRDAVTETTKTLKSARFRKAVDGVSSAAELIEAVTGASKSEQSELAEAREFVRKDLDAVDKDLETLFGRLS